MSKQKALAVIQKINMKVDAGVKSIASKRMFVGGFSIEDGLPQIYTLGDVYDPNSASYARILNNIMMNANDEVAVIKMDGQEFIAGGVDRGNFTSVQLAYPTMTDNGQYIGTTSIVESTQDSTNPSNTSTTAYVAALTTSITLPNGTWKVNSLGGVDCQHSTGGGVSIHIVVGAGTSLNVVETCPTTGFRKVQQRGIFSGIAGGSALSLSVEYRCNTAGTTTTSNPFIFAVFERTA